MGKHLGFTGTQQELPIPQQISLGHLLTELIKQKYTWMHNGDCIGADFTAAKLWTERGGAIFLHPPGINTKRAFFSDPDDACHPKPYRERNQDIIDASEILVACPKGMQEELRSGTWMTIRMAHKKGIPVTFVWPDGSITYNNYSSQEV